MASKAQIVSVEDKCYVSFVQVSTGHTGGWEMKAKSTKRLRCPSAELCSA